VRAVAQERIVVEKAKELLRLTLFCMGWFCCLFFFSAREALPTWDKQIQSLCFQVNNLLEKISQIAPEWTAQAMEAQMAQ